MDFNFKNQDFKSLLRNKQYLINKQTTSIALESQSYKILFANLKSMIESNAFKGAKVILIKIDEFNSIELKDTNNINNLFSNNLFSTSGIIEIDRRFDIIDQVRERMPDKSHEARRLFLEFSKNGYVVFHLIESFINVFINEEEFPESPFLSIEDKRRHHQKKDISQLHEVFDQYREKIKDQPVYCKFFISKSHLTAYQQTKGDSSNDFIPNNSHILNNRCEDKFREDLRIFLKDHLLVNIIIKEYILDSKKRLDILLVDEFGVNFYLIEVKWVGESINPKGVKVSTKFNANDINPNAFIQTLNYLEELDNKGENIVKAYLVVFDARKDDLEDTGLNFNNSLLTTTQRKHFAKFEKVKDFRVKNIHPS
ncbi:hypothetical protein [Sphingobacterium multivorum]|uniref:hypothetical protein n=1 Tax=Sphingobacterium multivorum TaxID=28454 RepID=UPI0028A9392C|nr:hypothetical protein [Sphingobacterium multivorum]